MSKHNMNVSFVHAFEGFSEQPHMLQFVQHMQHVHRACTWGTNHIGPSPLSPLGTLEGAKSNPELGADGAPSKLVTEVWDSDMCQALGFAVFALFICAGKFFQS